MTLRIHRDRNFEKLLNWLRNAGGHASLAARNADELIDKLANGGSDPDDIGRHTKHGEARIKNCLKYNLGNGYRLICVRQGRFVVLLYIGTHDDADLWLEKNRGLQVRINDEFNTVSLVQGNEVEEADAWQETGVEADEYEEMLLKKVDDKILRQVFCGLCRERC